MTEEYGDHAFDKPEADSLDQQRPTRPEPAVEPAGQFEASDGDLADQATVVRLDEDDFVE
ncbi:hypothetical protein [Thermocrispum sp.]|jgi:hypothetical protein|uniref:Uncharacterized protein n=1 Tax=Thermocrispum agreste TaxID=37925 RepID=A0A2W4JKT5_9PSEU|nr:hypothetical protein [Thermocrispum sp.]PZM94387.1 MAG: hypothetical protein DIU77_14310 [Thermocrispum agreste]